MNRVKVGFFSLSSGSPDGDDRAYLAWHQLDHMPEQYQLPGIVLGQRWVSTPACRAARAAGESGWSEVDHVVCYLMGEPVDETIDDFYALGQTLAEAGRFPHSLPGQYRGGLALAETWAAPRVLVSKAVVPFRPHRGIYLIVEEYPEGVADAAPDRPPTGGLSDLLATVPGVAGAWRYRRSPAISRPRFTDGDIEMTVCYLDDDPATVGRWLAPRLEEQSAGQPSRLVLAAPFESMMVWQLDAPASAPGSVPAPAPGSGPGPGPGPVSPPAS
ncbi:MAG TPA: hypothetical protein VG205_07400 [Acidimicrobiales bacterium]|nr:hypothetical protein [Acidimicrobiales bacterium]